MGSTLKFIKKIKEKGPQSSPEARAARLKKLRNMANLSRKQICDKYDLNVSTYKGWEIARFGGLPLDGARKVINRVAEEGVVCSLDWLLHGEGIGPTISVVSEGITTDETTPSVLQEVLLYKSLSGNVIFTEIMDDGMMPPYSKGDYVAGEKKYSSDIDKLLNKDCIIQLDSGEIVVRKLKKGTEKNKYTLVCTNIDTAVKQSTQYDVRLKCAAQIVRHYKIE